MIKSIVFSLKNSPFIFLSSRIMTGVSCPDKERVVIRINHQGSQSLKAAVIVFPGSNCDRDVAVALAATMGKPPVMVWHRETQLPDVDLVVVPGGFSYGDYLRCGAMAARSPIMREVVARVDKGLRVLGICNGFQILTEAGLLPGSLMRNRDLRFICRDVYLKVENADSDFCRHWQSGDIIRMPIAHAEGNYFADQETVARLFDGGQVAFRYANADGSITPDANPNGALSNIAGITNPARTVLGLMPHPERLADAALGGTDGRHLFESLMESMQ
jgi:phosphoribosylformylglycinamidine synthase subunit PurQ / glutaminase